jgi:hypothetical protein
MVKIDFGADGDEFAVVGTSCRSDASLEVVSKYDGDGNVLQPVKWKRLEIQMDNCGMHALAMALLERIQLTDRRGPF